MADGKKINDVDEMSDERSWMGLHSLGASFSTGAGWRDASLCAPLSDGSGGDGRATFCDG